VAIPRCGLLAAHRVHTNGPNRPTFSFGGQRIFCAICENGPLKKGGMPPGGPATWGWGSAMKFSYDIMADLHALARSGKTDELIDDKCLRGVYMAEPSG
jgi:hypothetical protein